MMALFWDTYTGTSTGYFFNNTLTSSSSSTTAVTWTNTFPTTGATYSGGWSGITGTVNVPLEWTRAPEPTPEQRAQWAQMEVVRQDRERQARAVADAERKVASEKAETLLRDHLTATQLAQLIQADTFDVLTDSGRRYRVTRGVAGNVFLLEKDKAKTRYCIHPGEDIPAADVMLAQKLVLENDEAYFLRTANATQLAA